MVWHKTGVFSDKFRKDMLLKECRELTTANCSRNRLEAAGEQGLDMILSQVPGACPEADTVYWANSDAKVPCLI